MTTLLELELEDGSVVQAEVSSDGDGLEQAGLGEVVRVKMADFLERSATPALRVLAALVDRSRSELAEASEVEVSVTFGLTASGDIKFVTSEASGTISLKATWKNE